MTWTTGIGIGERELNRGNFGGNQICSVTHRLNTKIAKNLGFVNYVDSGIVYDGKNLPQCTTHSVESTVNDSEIRLAEAMALFNSPPSRCGRPSQAGVGKYGDNI